MALQSVPPVAVSYGQRQRRERNAALYEIDRLWGRVDTADVTGGFLAIAPELLDVANTAQARMGQAAVEYVPEVLDQTGQSRADRPRFTTRPDAMVGTAGSGVGTEVVAYGAVTRTKAAIETGMAPDAAKRQAGQWLTAAFSTVLADTGRITEGVAGFSRPVGGYVRMLNGESCGRCIILAGKFYRKNAGFQRHPGCDCRHIPSSENVGGDMTTSPTGYLDELDDDRLAKALGSKSNARAYKDGADPYQLVNAYRKGGVRTAQQYGRNVKYTTEGTTRFGVAGRQMREVRALSQVGVNGGSRRVTAVRMMPESIYAAARDQAHADQMLRDFGWIVNR